MRAVELAVYADALAGEAASLSARAERASSRIRQAAIEKGARNELTAVAVSGWKPSACSERSTSPRRAPSCGSSRRRSTRSKSFSPGSRASWRPLPRREPDEQPPVVVVGGEEIGCDGFHVSDPRAQHELLAESANTPFQCNLRGALTLEPGQPERFIHIASHQLLLAEAGELEHIPSARDDAR